MADFIWPIVSIGILVLIVLIGVLVLWKTRAMLKEKKSGFPLTDERTQKLNGKAAYYAMFICQYFILAYLWVNFHWKRILWHARNRSRLPNDSHASGICAIFSCSPMVLWQKRRTMTDNANQDKRVESQIRPHPRRSRKKGGSTKRNHPLHRKRKLQSLPQAGTRHCKGSTDNN